MSAHKTFLSEHELRRQYLGTRTNSCQETTQAQVESAEMLFSERSGECCFACGVPWNSASGTISVVGPLCLSCTQLYVELGEYC